MWDYHLIRSSQIQTAILSTDPSLLQATAPNKLESLQSGNVAVSPVPPIPLAVSEHFPSTLLGLAIQKHFHDVV